MKLKRQELRRSHEWIDQRSLALDKAIAARLRGQPELLQRAKDTLQEWLQQRQPTPPHVLVEWQEILSSWSFEEILMLLISSEPEPTRLRQSSPFCGILTQKERRKVLQEYESRRA